MGHLHSSAVIRIIAGRLAWYPPGTGEEPLWLDDKPARERLRAALAEQRSAPCFAAPGVDVRLLTISLSAEEKKHIGKSLPFMLEEQVTEDIEQLHFASAALDKLRLAVAVCTRERMQAWQAQLADFPGVRLWLPEPLLLPWREGEWCILCEDDQALVRFDQCGGFSVERELLPAMLAGLQAQCPAPAAIVIYGQEQAADIALLPEALQSLVQWRRGKLQSALMLGESAQPALNLLQGEFARRLPVSRWWREWRAVAAVFAIAFGLQLVASYTDYLKLQRDNLALRGAVEESYRKAYPRGAVVDAETQLRRQLAQLRGSGQVSGFVHLIEQVGAVVAANPGTSVAAINYNFSDRGGEMRMNILASDFEAVERVRADINKAGLQAVMENSSAQGDQVRARLRVGEKT
jgi:type II secretion system protein L